MSDLFILIDTTPILANADALVPLVFSIIVGPVIVRSLTARLVANSLHVATPEATGVFIVCANAVATVIARALKEAGKHLRGARDVLAGFLWQPGREIRWGESGPHGHRRAWAGPCLRHSKSGGVRA